MKNNNQTTDPDGEGNATLGLLAFAIAFTTLIFCGVLYFGWIILSP